MLGEDCSNKQLIDCEATKEFMSSWASGVFESQIRKNNAINNRAS